jgi:hypothetical protein
VELYLYSPNTPSWRGAQLKHKDNFIFTFTNNRKDGVAEIMEVETADLQKRQVTADL